MTAAQALYNFYASFGLEAYEENTVPTGSGAAPLPRITYSVAMGEIGAHTALYADLWYRGTSWSEPGAKAREIHERLGRGGVMLPCDGGAIWLQRGQPYANYMGDEADDTIRRVHLNITAEFLM